MSGLETAKIVSDPEQPAPATIEVTVEVVLAHYHGDPCAAIDGLLAAVRTLKGENRALRGKVSSGYTRLPPSARE
jgi:hypothetical protein